MSRFSSRDVARTQWWCDHNNLAALYRWLYDHGEIDPEDVGATVYLLRYPWKRTREFAEMCEGNTDLETRLIASLREVGVCDLGTCDEPTADELCEPHAAHKTIPSPPPEVVILHGKAVR